MRAHLLWITALLATALPQSASARVLTDGISGSVGVLTEPGLTEVFGQQAFHPRFGLVAAYEREAYADATYAGWRMGANFLLGRLNGSDWQASSVVGLGLAGMKGPEHDHSALWTRIEMDWESRRVLFGISGELQRGNRMPGIDTGQLRAGYSPLQPDLVGVQPWAVLSWFTRSGTGTPELVGILRLVGGAWWLEIGSALSSSDRFLNFAIGL